MALQNVQEIQIALDGNPPFEYVVMKSEESGSRTVNITLLENQKEFEIPSGTTAKIKYYKPDGKFVLNPATIDGNIITVEYTEQMLAASGTGRGEIVLYNGTAVLRSATYYTKIVPTVYNENGLISDNEFLEMAESIIAVNEATDKALNATASAEEAASAANTAASNANTATSAANTATSNANTAATAANTGAAAANTAATKAESAASSANTAAAAANNAATAAKTATTNAETATSNADKKASAAETAAANANAAAKACENIAAGINSMTDATTGKTYTIGVDNGLVYLEEVS